MFRTCNIKYFKNLSKNINITGFNKFSVLNFVKYNFSNKTNINEITIPQNKNLKLSLSSLSNQNLNININEPEDFRTVYIENLPHDWKEIEIKVRLEQLGNLEKMTMIKNSIGEFTGKVLAVYTKLDNLIEAINHFKEKMPFFKPLKIRFFREFRTKKQDINKNPNFKSEVLLIKNIPSDLPKQDLHLFLSEFREPVHISFPRDEENEFKRIAYVYYLTIDDAEYVLKYANLRYVKNKQLFFSYSINHYDLIDFRSRAELGIKLDPKIEIKLFDKQIENYKSILLNKGEYTKKDVEKMEYFNMRVRKLEYQIKDMLGIEKYKQIESDENVKKISVEQKQIRGRKYSYNQDKSIIFVDKKNMFKK